SLIPNTYIVNLDNELQKPSPFPTHEFWHLSLLQSLADPIADEELFLYSYTHVMHGFSCRLTEAQLSEIEKWSAHVVTYPETFGKLLTTHTPEFIGLHHDSGLWPNSSYDEGIIIGVNRHGHQARASMTMDNQEVNQVDKGKA
ncbi:unnamed protein product, partial [Linum tenue]